MASATGIPESNPATNRGDGADEPLLGRAGDASQQEGKGLQFNFVLGEPSIQSGGIVAAKTPPDSTLLIERSSL